ncbi:MAG: protein translocase SEC61 complex subunit gamma [Candidatus Micrarchaeaceae archaeon]
MNLNPISGLKRFYEESKHIMSVSYRPTHDEFMRTLKIVAIGVIILGIIGFIIAILIGAIT